MVVSYVCPEHGVQQKCACCEAARRVEAVEPTVKRVPVDFNYEAVNPGFLKRLAMIGSYAAEKYGSWDQYTAARLTGEKSCINHAYEHLRKYVEGEPYDHFDGHVTWHLVAVAYNCMMEMWYCLKFGHVPHPLTVTQTAGEAAKEAADRVNAADSF
jgi:hypothetical protein